MEQIDIIEMDNQEYGIREQLLIDGKKYFILSKITDEKLDDEQIVLREEDGMLYSLEPEEEEKLKNSKS